MMTHGCCIDNVCTPDTCMELPEGETCGDCYHITVCYTFCGHEMKDTYCDWFPRRFIKDKPPSTKERG